MTPFGTSFERGFWESAADAEERIGAAVGVEQLRGSQHQRRGALERAPVRNDGLEQLRVGEHGTHRRRGRWLGPLRSCRHGTARDARGEDAVQ